MKEEEEEEERVSLIGSRTRAHTYILSSSERPVLRRTIVQASRAADVCAADSNILHIGLEISVHLLYSCLPARPTRSSSPSLERALSALEPSKEPRGLFAIFANVLPCLHRLRPPLPPAATRAFRAIRLGFLAGPSRSGPPKAANPVRLVVAPAARGLAWRQMQLRAQRAMRKHILRHLRRGCLRRGRRRCCRACRRCGRAPARRRRR